MKKAHASQVTSRREFATSVAAAFVVAPLITSQTEAETNRSDDLEIKRDDSEQPAKQGKQQEKPRILMEHIPPIIIGDGSVEMESKDNFPPPVPISSTNHRRNWKYSLYPSGTIVERIKIICKDGNVADVNLSEDYGELRLWMQEWVASSSSWVPATTDEPNVLLNGRYFTMEIQEKLTRQPDQLKPHHPIKHKHDGLTSGMKPLRIGRVQAINENRTTMYDNTSAEGYLIMIWKHS